MRTWRDYLIMFILMGIIAITIGLLYLIFGDQPLANPIASGILITVVIVSCCLLSMNRYIIAYFKTKTSGENVMCPFCKKVIKSNHTTCPYCQNPVVGGDRALKDIMRGATTLCPDCGTMHQSGTHFCTKCGGILD